MHYEIIVEPEALQDLFLIKKYITEQDTLSKANKFISELRANIKTLMKCLKDAEKAIILMNQMLMTLFTKNILPYFRLEEI